MGLRKDRLADEIRDLVAQLLTGGRMNDPRLQSVAITGVKLTADLQLASVYFRFWGEITEREVKAGLKSASVVFRTVVAQRIDMKKAPQLRFFYDKSVEYGSHIEDLFRHLKDEPK